MEVSKKLSNKCKICQGVACISLTGNDYCLLHYHTHIPISISTNNTPNIINQDQLDIQSQHVSEMWEQAIGDVVLRMMEYQHMEQEEIRKDPLSVLALNAPRVSLASSQRKRQSQVDSDQPSAKSKKPNLWNVRSADLKRKFEENKTNNGESNVDEDFLRFGGNPCRECKSTRTVLKYSGGVESGAGGTRSETWGFKDRPSTDTGSSVTTTCKDCGYSWTENT